MRSSPLYVLDARVQCHRDRASILLNSASPLYVLDARVQCPLGGEVDVERCFMCPQFCRMGEANGHDAIWCRGGSRWFDLWTMPWF